jgi:hypothetical protein
VALPVEYRDGYAHVQVTLRDGHGMVVFDAPQPLAAG